MNYFTVTYVIACSLCSVSLFFNLRLNYQRLAALQHAEEFKQQAETLASQCGVLTKQGHALIDNFNQMNAINQQLTGELHRAVGVAAKWREECLLHQKQSEHYQEIAKDLAEELFSVDFQKVP